MFDQCYLDYERFDRMVSDEMILIGNTQNRAENVFRLIEVLDPNGKELHLVTNRFDLIADEIC